MNSDKVVLIVEDSATIRFQVKTLLKPLGIQLREAGGEIGLFNLIEEYGRLADVIIMDLTLKNEDGFQLIKKLREHDSYQDIPILVLTEHADAEHVLTAKKLGVEGYIRKPINKDFIKEKVLEILHLETK
ncbi:MAG: cheY [Clostridia bacterium]|jgi:CheY-like chemotaxis protein|nr:cheY [Clostridia bacterium]